jgi:ribosomal protein S18 acetylase RimI-like enzyme
MREHVDRVWGWDDEEQEAFFARRWDPGAWQVIEIAGRRAGLLILRDEPEELYVAEIQLEPQQQGRGVGTAILRLLMERGKPVTLRVLHVNPRARVLYERLGFRPTHEIETHVYLRWEPSTPPPSLSS